MSVSINTALGQSEYYVTAKNGLIVRDQPNIKGKRIGKFPYGNKITVLEVTNKTLIIKNDGKEVTGHWVKVSDIASPYSIENNNPDSYYVFDGFLSKNTIPIKRFVKSEEYKITKVDTSLIDNEDYLAFAFIKNKKHKKIQKFKVWMDSYKEDFTSIEEIKNPNLKNIRKIIKVTIEHCACQCHDDVYYWLVTNQSKWVQLPTIEMYDMDIGNPYQEYVFNTSTNGIDLIEFKEEFIHENPKVYTSENVKHIYLKHLNTLYWDGKKVKD
ncbi:SH3 domain-containing protein [Aquimarina sp. I32.4]|uniref:SH3 domain-containing protein n=1 Tax=Aquimarina sp. I32.4 TaxID=2053903 RepID=UPI001304C3EF|nr:SH3 domain-containing protein [Aquimarina sp. I32.4]